MSTLPASASRTPRIAAEAVLSIVLGLGAALLVTLGASRWMPAGPGGVNHLIIPAILFPAVWTCATLALFALRPRAATWVTMGLVSAANATLILWGMV